jgi:hypothetical protein
MALVNIAESIWLLVMIWEKTVASRWTESVKRCMNRDLKFAFTFFATIVEREQTLSNPH